MPDRSGMPTRDAAYWACVLEVCEPKVGNVHPLAAFADVTWRDFVNSAVAIAPQLAIAPLRPVGETILACVRVTRDVVASNTNLGIILLLSPLSAIRDDETMETGIGRVLTGLTVEDARLAYEAIRLAKPSGLGHAKAEDVRSLPLVTLREAMVLAAERDTIARQYVESFRLVFQIAAQWPHSLPLNMAIVCAHLRQVAREPDSLIVRKCGIDIGRQAMQKARTVFHLGWPFSVRSDLADVVIRDLDRWLREDGHRRNPGTSADLIAAALFVMLRRGEIAPPFPWAERILQCL
jgi:triphosphoribosyl-dephospho-CoA synthase